MQRLRKTMSADRPAGQCTGFWQAKGDQGITAYLSASVCCARDAAPLKSSAHGVAHSFRTGFNPEHRLNLYWRTLYLFIIWFLRHRDGTLY